MNKNSIKKFAIESRVWLRGKIEAKLGELGISKGGIGGAYQQTDTEVKATELSTKAVSRVQYESLRKYAMGLKKSYSDSWYDELIEECAYTWFNRVIGIKYMEINGYLPDKINVLTSSTGKVETDIMINFEYLSFADRLDKEFIRNGLLDHKTEEVFRYIFLEQNHELSKVMPFMFKSENDFSDLIFPDGMLGDNGIVSKINTMIESEDWKEIEIIGWLYQFYNQDRRDVIFDSNMSDRKKIDKEYIPAATQIFTPKWIVKYLVENALGRLTAEKLEVNEKVLSDWKYYIKNPIDSDSEKISIEKIKFIDPAMGSGNILIYAFELFYKIYEELGYSKKDAVISILNNNLYGLEIDDRAAQLASFSMIMKGREQYVRIFNAIENKEINLKVIAIQESNSITDESNSIRETMAKNGLENLVKVTQLYENAKEYGSILKIKEIEIEKLEEERKILQEKEGLFYNVNRELIDTLINQVSIMSDKYDVVITNPPYMGNARMSPNLKTYIQKEYPDVKSDLFSVFISESRNWSKKGGFIGLVTPYVWWFISSFEKLRLQIVETTTIETMTQLEYNAFEGACIPVGIFVLRNEFIEGRKGEYIKLSDFRGAENQPIKTLEAIENPNCGWRYTASQADFEKIPGSPIAYWVSDRIRKAFNKKLIGDLFPVKKGADTGENAKYIRLWQEVEIIKIGIGLFLGEETIEKNKKWVPYNKGGEFHRWYGNKEYLINWENNGEQLKNSTANLRSPQLYFKNGITWNALTSTKTSARFSDYGALFDSAGSSMFPLEIELYLSFINSKVVDCFLQLLNPTLNYGAGTLSKLPQVIIQDTNIKSKINDITQSCIDISRAEWDSRETSWDFKVNPLIEFVNSENNQIETSYNMWCKYALNQFIQLHENEEELNRLFIDIYGLQDEMTPDVDFEDITLFKKELKDRTGLVGAESISARNDEQQSARNDENHWADMESAPTEITKHFDKSEIIKQFISYAVGCNMGRYSIDKEGLIIANSDDKLIVGADSISAQNTESISAQNTPTITITGSDGEIRHEITNARYIPDSDAIVPITDTNYFAGEDILERFEEFLAVTYGADTLEENLNFIANGIKESKNPARAVLRDYFMGDFMADHIKRYSSRPIYWMVSSNGKGKGAAFNALIYLHRYNKNTIPAIRGKYVNELQAKLNSKLEFADKKLLEDGLSTKEKNELKTEREKYRKQINELLEFDKKLNALANQNIELDLDDGVKVNYKKLDGILYKIKFSGD